MQPLAKIDFAPYGEYYTMPSPDSHMLCGEIHGSELIARIILPECTYANDCTVVDLKEDELFLIEK